MYNTPHHSFHIPVMGLAYTVDTPIKVAPYGISSVMSIVEDRLIEMMRKHYYPTMGWQYHAIPAHIPDSRAKRITDYLNMVNFMVQEQVDKIKSAAFEAGSEIVKYFELLPEENRLKQLYRQMMNSGIQPEKEKIENYLRSQIIPGAIDVNIMTKTDRNNYEKDGSLIEDGSDAVAALRGYAKSNLTNSSVIFSAGMNPRLYNYLGNCEAFFMNEQGQFNKKIIIKVSDYRSALIQGKYLAKKGLWVSEFRIESGLNCGGHAFATEGYLMGPILEEFKTKKQELIDTLFELYNDAQFKKTNQWLTTAPVINLSAQGGIGTYEEDIFLHQQYKLNSTGWGTPFLLVPEATTVDPDTINLLIKAEEKDIELSYNSPLGVRFYYLKGSSAEKEKLDRIAKGHPGSPCSEKHLAFNTEFTQESVCTASRQYQELKIASLDTMQLTEKEYNIQLKEVLAKECLCVGLSNAAAICHKEVFIKNRNEVNICPGPNIVNFSEVVSLQTMIDHIYGRVNIMNRSERPHMFIAELNMYLDYLKEQIEKDIDADTFDKKKKYYAGFYQNLRAGILYYRTLKNIAKENRQAFVKALFYADLELDALQYQYSFN
ncbi:MAG: hypothetical protein WCJ85_03070 [Chitinophagaceae bacterium]